MDKTELLAKIADLDTNQAVRDALVVIANEFGKQATDEDGHGQTFWLIGHDSQDCAFLLTTCSL
jgi:hypothetical protein